MKINDSKKTSKPDLVVIGGGNAGLCAAIVAAEAGLQVLILEAAPKTMRGGNSRHTRNFRCMHSSPVSVLTGVYSSDEYYDDLLKVTAGNTDEVLAKLVIDSSEECLQWMYQQGVRFQPALSGTLSLSRTNAFFLGGGTALLNAYYRRAQQLGISILYDASVRHLQVDGDLVSRVDYQIHDQSFSVSPQAIAVAAGGFQADIDWLARAWGPAARNFLIRGTPFNTGLVLKNLLDQGAQSVGDPTQCHAVAIDGRAPKFDGGIVTRLDCVVYSIVVNKHGKRFYNEGEDVWPKRYAIWGRLVAAQPDQVGYAIVDSRSLNLFMPSVFPPMQANTIEELAELMDLPGDQLRSTIHEFNNACGDESGFHPTELDGVATSGLALEKTNWARRISEPPFYGYSLKPGVTFTYLGLKVDEKARVQSESASLKNLWAAGETMAGSILGQGYLAGFGMTIGTVFGRIAGREAANYVK